MKARDHYSCRTDDVGGTDGSRLYAGWTVDAPPLKISVQLRRISP